MDDRPIPPRRNKRTLAEATPRRLSADELQSMMLDVDIPDSQIRPYLQLDLASSRAFGPVVRVDPSTITESVEESAFALAQLNSIARWRRHRVYRRRIENWSGPVAVSEGDSWFQFPFLLDDVIDVLGIDYPIFSLGAAGDLLSEMVQQDELVGAIKAENPDIVFLSGGGNDLLGGGRLVNYLRRYREGRPASEYTRSTFDTLLNQTLEEYGTVFEAALSAGAPRIVCHAYDNAIPDGGRWLGRPFAALGIVDQPLQRRIIAHLIDRFHLGLSELSRRQGFAGRIVVADARDAVGEKDWWDELHPNDAGFARVAAAIKQSIAEADETETPIFHTAAALPIALARSDAMAFADHDEAVLIAELGRRVKLMGGSPEIAGLMNVEVTITEDEGLFDPFYQIGRRILRRLHRELHDLMCGTGEDDVADRKKLADAFGLGEAAVTAAIASVLVGSLGVAPYVAPVVAAILYKRGVKPTIAEVCVIWGEALEA
ncbi:hypothetical protein [Acuticoccus mangrovi]|uniref:SGNH hydrolase-type esterase domain-containing protein n=1 Tax=Acuticoccus mangrovi TaxID=2796142 RepID=A0A934MJL7_9HYPH|nr:hypothetical protein [Acuticoccus mangrovi]MBJ3778436.1 hypothetical protein [Acuticoccus mangrovi]